MKLGNLLAAGGARRRRTAAALALVAAAPALFLVTGARRGELPARPDLNVLLITLDTTRRDHLGCYGHRGVKTPALDGLARSGVLFENAVTPVPLTCPAHSTILTGLFPCRHGVRNNGGFSLSPDRVTLAEMLQERGYRTGAFISAYVLNRVFGLQQGFDVYDDDLSQGQESVQEGVFTARERRAEAVAEKAIHWLREKPDQKFFLWAHFYDPHHPFNPPAPFRSEYQSDLYSGEIAYMDTQVGRLLAVLDELDLRRKTIVIAVGDHGESLWEHQEQNHAFFIYDAVLRVPFIVSCPPARGLEIPRDQRRGGQVRLVDLLPTVLSMLEVPAPAGIQGATLLPYMAEKRDPPDMDLYCETLLPMLDYGWSDLIGVRTGRWKYIDAPQRELYDLARDPWEIDNLAEKLPDQVEELRRRLAGLLAGETGVPAESWSTMKMTDDMRRNLQALGYVGGPGGGESSARPARADSLGIRAPAGRDPKEVIGIFGRIQTATLAMYRRDWDEAIRQLDLALAIEPTNKAAHRYMGDCYRQKNILGRAEEHYRQVLLADPHFPQVLNNLGALYIDLGRYPEALDLLRKAVAVRASMSDAHNNLGAVLLETGRLDEAIPSFRHAVELDPSLIAARMNLASCYAQKGMWGEAAAQLEEVLRLDPNHANAQRGLRAAERQLGAAKARPRGS